MTIEKQAQLPTLSWIFRIKSFCSVKFIYPHRMTAFIFLLLLFPSVAQAQFSNTEETHDYKKIIQEGLHKNGRFLNLSGKKLGDEGLKYLLTHPALEKVTKLDLRYNKISAAGAKILADAAVLPQLKILILRHNFLADQGTVELAKSKSFPNLTELQLGWNEVRDQGALALGQTQSFPKLKKLDLRGNFLAEKTKNSLRQSLAHLKSLKLF
jgi:Ran GTPase-activating protein (RanGAP) involved in mRNA processing and transport